MTFQLQDVNKINGILQMTEPEVAATVDGDILYIDKSNKNPKLKAGATVSLTTLRTTNLYNKTDNTDLNIDALGTGRILLNTAQLGGVRITSNSITAFPLVIANPTGTRVNVLGVYDSGGESRPVYGAHNAALNAFAPIWISPSGDTSSPIIMGNFSQAIAQTITDCKLFVEGNITTRSSMTLGLNTSNGFRHHIDYTAPTGVFTHTLGENNGNIANIQQCEMIIPMISNTLNLVASSNIDLAITPCKGYNAYKPLETNDCVLRIITFSNAVDSFPCQLQNKSSGAILTTFNISSINGYSMTTFTFSKTSLDANAFMLCLRGSASATPVAVFCNVVSAKLYFGVGS